jgi:dTDP-4-dehydrorhamnose 3,5-epimerase
MALTRNDIAENFRDRVTVQDYSPKPTIDGVRFLPLKRFVDDGGSFMELGRLTKGELQDVPGFEARQVSYSTMLPGVIKAFHLHFNQSELWFVPPESRLVMGLLDVRAKSPTSGARMRFVMGDGQARFVFIPAGVAHGAANLSDRTGQIIYFMNQQFTPEPDKSDEKRLPWDVLGADFWTLERG